MPALAGYEKLSVTHRHKIVGAGPDEAQDVEHNHPYGQVEHWHNKWEPGSMTTQVASQTAATRMLEGIIEQITTVEDDLTAWLRHELAQAGVDHPETFTAAFDLTPLLEAAKPEPDSPSPVTPYAWVCPMDFTLLAPPKPAGHVWANGRDCPSTPDMWIPVYTADHVLSNVQIDGKPITWREHAEHQTERLRTAGRFQQLCYDLDRCEHGRHQGDTCAQCEGVGYRASRGNPCLPADRTIGFTIDGDPITVPERGVKHDPNTWTPPHHPHG